MKRNDIKRLLDSMADEISRNGRYFAFLELRLSAERFIVPLCGYAAQSILAENLILFEKKIPGINRGPVDLVITNKGDENLRNAIFIEFKMLWKGGFKENISGIRNDLEKLKNVRTGYVIACIFSFDKESTPTMPYSHEYDIGDLFNRTRDELNDPLYHTLPAKIKNSEVSGNIMLAIWKA